jgi:CheY-like chemotaxis protein
MTKRVLDIGNCDPDHAALRGLIEDNFHAAVDRAHHWQDAEKLLRATRYDLVLVNRKLDVDYSDGLEIVKQIKGDAELASVPVMLVTNYADHQALAVQAGALPGFGKLEFAKPETRDKLAAVLGASKGTTAGC